MKTAIYLAGPMAGIEDHNYPAFNDHADAIRAHGYSVTNPAETFNGDKSLPYSMYLERGLEQIFGVDAVAVLEGWENSRGARLEVHLAKVLGKRILVADALCHGQEIEVMTAIPTMAAADTTERSSRFNQLLNRMRALHDRKRADYTGNSGDILHNYRTSASLAGISTFQGMFSRLCEKVVRVSSLTTSGNKPQVQDESMADTLFDLSIISLLCIIALEQEREALAEEFHEVS